MGGWNPDDGRIFRFSLKEGFVSMTSMNAREPMIPSWNFLPTLNKVPLSSLVDFSVLLGNAPICTPSQIRACGFQIIHQGYLMMVYHGRFAVEAVFVFDSSIEEYLEDDDLPERICSTANPGSMGQGARSLLGVTVRLLFLQVKLEVIQSRLDRLGIRTDVE